MGFNLGFKGLINLMTKVELHIYSYAK